MPVDLMPQLRRDFRLCATHYFEFNKTQRQSQAYYLGRIGQIAQTVSYLGGDEEFDQMYRQFRDKQLISTYASEAHQESVPTS